MLRRVAHEGEAVLDLQRDPRIVEGAVVDRLQVFARDVDNAKVDFADGHRFDRRVLQQFFGRTAVTAAHDQRASRLRVRDRGDVDQVFVVEKLVLLGRHEMAVQAKQLAELHGLVHLDRLIR